MAALIALHGETMFTERLQWVFDTDRFVMWNEPDMGYPYLFTFVDGEAHRAQRETRAAMDQHFGTGPDGLPGNDDVGSLSAWFVFSAKGISMTSRWRCRRVPTTRLRTVARSVFG